VIAGAIRCWGALLLGAVALVSPARAQFGDRGDEAKRLLSSEIQVPAAPVLSPTEALRSFVLPPQFRIELVAAEPLVQDPVMMTFDARGRMWVAELSGYNIPEFVTQLPVYLDRSRPVPKPPKGRVVVLEDTDGDGKMDRRTVYWDDMDVPRAIGFVGDWVLIGDPPRLWVTRDRDGDGVMDEKISLDDNYGTFSNVEGSPNGLLWGRDNWLYNASYVWRWRMKANGEWEREPVPAVGQWGITQDDYGRMFFNSNSDQLRGNLVPSHTIGGLDRRTGLHGVNIQVATDQSTFPVRPTPGVNRGYAGGQSHVRETGKLPAFTAASAPVIYRGTNFPPSFVGNAFVPEPAGNLVKRNLLLESDGRLIAQPAYANAEFLGSTDERFRPVFLSNGPDGALYIVDYYRGILEGYEFITTYLREQILQRGLNQPLWGLGRIYRIVYTGRPLGPRPDFAGADAAAMLRLLTDENGWTRDMAQRHIVDSRSSVYVQGLRDLLAHADQARDRVSALWCLEGLGALSGPDLEMACADANARVRVSALQAAYPRLHDATGQQLLQQLAARVATEEPLVLAHLALALSKVKERPPLAREILWRLLPRAAEHPALADGLLLALRGDEGAVMEWLRRQIVPGRPMPFGAEMLFESLGARIVLGDGQHGAALAAAICDPELPQLGRLALMRGATKVRGAGLSAELLQQLATTAPDAWVRRTAEEGLTALKDRAAKAARRPKSRPLTPPQEILFELGRNTYGLCAACHQPDGLGRPDLAPALKEGRWTNAISPDAAIRIVLHGKQGTPGYAAPMVPLANLDDERLAGVLTFVRRSYGNDAPAVEPRDIARVRSETLNRLTPWTDRELAAFSEETR